MIDCHLHTNFSPDSSTKPELLIENAISLGCEHIAITDHLDPLMSLSFDEASSKLQNYFITMDKLKKKYEKDIYISIGLEVSFKEKVEQQNKRLIETCPFEYIINSIHDVKDSDCYYQEHFIGRERDTVYTEYFEAVLQSLSANYPFDAIGHLSYISRTAPYKNNKVHYSEFTDILDKILLTAAQKDIIIEMNTNVYTSGETTLPALDILKRYREIGGKLICFSSDAHSLSRLCEGYADAVKTAKLAGFDSFAVKQNGKIKLVKI